MRYADFLLEGLRKKFFEGLEKGKVCPCCEKYGQIYKRILNATMARSLIWMVRRFRQQPRWIKMSEEAPRHIIASTQYPLMKHWGLVERRTNDDPKKKHSGYWRPTKLGMEFADNRIAVPAYVWEYNDSPRSFAARKITVVEALGEEFDYVQLMRGNI